jgi:hypothetical protein
MFCRGFTAKFLLGFITEYFKGSGITIEKSLFIKEHNGIG